MKDNSLQTFYQDKDMRDNVHEYLVEFFKEEAVKRLLDREDGVALADAIEMTDQAFEHLEILFDPKSNVRELKNEAR